jgi:hypothetical protein
VFRPQLAIFMASNTERATRGASPCLLYRGRLASPPPPPGYDTCPDDSSSDIESSDFFAPSSICLYVGYDHPTPMLASRGRPANAAAAPYRVCLQDPDGGMISSFKGLETRIVIDEELRLVAWGPSFAIIFPAAADTRQFAACLRGIQVAWQSLRTHPAAAMAAAMVPTLATPLVAKRPGMQEQVDEMPPPQRRRVLWRGPAQERTSLDGLLERLENESDSAAKRAQP